MNRQGIKRSIKSARNLWLEPPPRNKQLVLSGVEYTATGFKLGYQAKGRRYSVAVELPSDLRSRFDDFNRTALEPTFCAISLAFSAFFFKLADFRYISVESFGLDEESAEFFSRSIQGGMGEFRFLQGLNPRKPITVTSGKPSVVAGQRTAVGDHLIMLNGGGKDTIVAGELLRLSGQDFTWVTIRPNEARRSVVKLSGNPNSVEIGYHVDDSVNNDKAYPWGHVPHTSIVLSLGLLVAQLIGAKYVCAGNEQSANFGNVNYKGFEVNHQYTKSFVYEKGFNEYVQRCVSPDIDVFSILRPFHDLQLAMIFSSMTSYHSSFLSCNRGVGRDEWCGSCSKCAFTALALYPFIGSKGCNLIFGRDILQNPVIRRYIVDLTTASIKPWECVGTQDESKLALKLILDQNPDLSFDSPPLRSDLERIVADFDEYRYRRELLESTCGKHLIPQSIVRRLNGSLSLLGCPLIFSG